MIKHTFQTESDYIKFVRTTLIFTHTRAYNAGAYLWKKEDIEFVKNLGNKELQKSDPKLWKKSVDIYLKAKDEYGDDMDYWKGIFEDYSGELVLRCFGFDYDADEDGDGVTYVASDLDVDIEKLKKTEDYPTSFPAVVLIESGGKHDGPNVMFAYLKDFTNPSSNMGDYSWLEENVRNFWKNGEGTYWGG